MTSATFSEVLRQIPPAAMTILNKLGLTEDRPHTWARLATSKEDAVAIAFDLDTDLEETEFRMLIELIWEAVLAARPVDEARRTSRLSRDEVVRAGTFFFAKRQRTAAAATAAGAEDIQTGCQNPHIGGHR